MRSWFNGVGGFGLLLLGAMGCSSEQASQRSGGGDAAVGSVGLELVPVSGVTLNSVNYVVTGTPSIPGTALPSGNLPTPGSASSFNFGVSVPVGTGYTLSLTAASAETGDDITCTGSFGPFNITPNSAANISVTLTCRDNTNGQLIAGVDVKTDACPRLVVDYAVAIPAEANVGSNIAVNALAHDLDGKPVTYAWSIPVANAAAGNFAAPGAQGTTFHCSASSGGDIHISVTAKNGECSKQLLTTIGCGNFDGCGNGQLDPGEDCDPGIPGGQPGAPFGCPADCTVTCGDGIVEAPAEECELNGGPPTATCTAQCRIRQPVCGDGFITPPEVCDGQLFPSGVTGGACGSVCMNNCMTIAAPAAVLCGDGVVQCGEECDPASSQTCSDACQTIASAACVACEQAGACVGESDGCLNLPAGPERAKCFAVQRCITISNCGDGANTLTSCFCGALSTSNCIAAPDTGPAAPAGACAAVIRAAMSIDGGVTTAKNSEVLTRFIDESVPGGIAIARYNCDKHDAACINVCGF